MIANTIAFILFLSVPTINTLRPDHINANVFWTWSINLVYHSSIGLHLFPSGHSLCMWMIVIVCIRRNTAKYFSAFSVAYAIIVSLSALFIKQHELVDVLCGFSIAISVGILVRYLPIFKFTNNLFIKINHFLHIWEW
jgi:membrane-associated phospholipid phosphatase